MVIRSGTGNNALSALRQPLKEVGVLLIFALAGTAASWALRADPLPLSADPAFYQLELDAPLIEPAAAIRLYDEGEYLFIETRPTQEESVATIPGAIPVRSTSFDDDLLDVFDFMQPGDPLILFGGDNMVPTSNIASRLKGRGYDNIKILRGGIKAWIKAHGPISRTSQPEQDF